MKSPYSTNCSLIIHPFSDDLDLKSSLIDRAKKNQENEKFFHAKIRSKREKKIANYE